jgi:hypothetical protein
MCSDSKGLVVRYDKSECQKATNYIAESHYAVEVWWIRKRPIGDTVSDRNMDAATYA